MERREQTTTTTTTTATPNMKQLINRFENAVHQAAKDDYVDGGSYVAMDRRAKAVEDARKALQAAFDDNQHAALVEQRDLLVGVLHQFAVNSSDGSGLCWCVVDPRVFDHSEQCLSARTALATVEQGEGA